MTQKELEQKVIDAEGRVAKREAVLKKHNSQLAKMIEKGADHFDISIKREGIKSATSKLAEGRELTDYDLANLWPRRDVDAFLSERGLEYRQIQKKLREAGDQITLKLLEIHNEDEREAWLEKTMEEEKRAKLLDLIGRIMSTVGTITDAAALYIGPEGDINGIIVGTEGKAKIQTIGAGGYNIQCFHFRTLIHEIK